MRIPLTNVHRAFPELDRFSDEQCRRFVRAACRRGWGRHVHRAGVGCVSVVLFGASIIGSVALFSSLDNHFRFAQLGFVLWGMLIFGAALLLPGLVMLLVKDRLLLRRIRHVLRDRAVCPGCRYSLLGMVVGERNLVLCPECGMEVEADPSLKELADDGDGRTVFQPSERVAARTFWTPKRVRRARRAARVVGVLLLIVLPVGLGGYELFLRQQAAVAAGERPGLDGMMKFVEAGQPEGTTPSDENVWEILLDVGSERRSVHNRVSGQPKYWDHSPRINASFEQIFSPRGDAVDPGQAETDRLTGELALEVIEACREAGVLDLLDSIAGAPRAVEELDLAPGEPLFAVILPQLEETRSLSRMNAARMQLAIDSGDDAEFLGAFESSLALARMDYHQPTLIQTLVGMTIENLAMRQAARAMARHPDAAWLDALEAAIARQRPALPRNHSVEGDRLMLQDTLAWVFTDPGRVRLGRFSSVASDLAGGWGMSSIALDKKLGTYAANRDRLNAYVDQVSTAIEQLPHDRKEWRDRPTGYVLLDLLIPAYGRLVEAVDQRDATRDAMAVMIALERHYIEQGKYPASLEELTPGLIAAVPIDPWSGERTLYRLLDESGQGYVLWAVGTDGINDGGDPDLRRSKNPDVIFAPAEE